MTRWRRLVAGVLLAALGGCLGARSPTPARSRCGDDPARRCEAECGAHPNNPRETPEGKCEAAVADLCRGACQRRCGDESREVAQRIEKADAYLEGHCGSGRSVDLPLERLAPTPHPLNELLR